MSDEVDKANDEVAQALALALRQHRQLTAVDPNAVSREDCEDCGNPIPAARRLALPGVTLCVACKHVEELKDRMR